MTIWPEPPSARVEAYIAAMHGPMTLKHSRFNGRPIQPRSPLRIQRKRGRLWKTLDAGTSTGIKMVTLPSSLLCSSFRIGQCPNKARDVGKKRNFLV